MVLVRNRKLTSEIHRFLNVEELRNFFFVLITRYHCGHQVKEDMLGWDCGTHEKYDEWFKNFSVKT
jgi:hypothetical protein